MQKKFIVATTGMLVIGIVAMFATGCGKTGSDLVGTWVRKNGEGPIPSKMELFRDGTGIQDEQFSATWKIEGKHFILTSASGYSGPYDYEISGNKLVLTNEKLLGPGKNATYVKQ